MRAMRLLACWMLCCALLLPGRSLAIAPELPLPQLGQQIWANAQGLPQATVYGMAQGKDGYLWLGTEEGLVRFNGEHFEVFNRSNTPAIPSNRIRTVHVDGNGDVWFGTQTAGLARLHQGTFERMGEAEGLTSQRIRAVRSGPSGAVYVGTDDSVWRWRNGKFEKLRELDTVRAVYEARDGTVWAGFDQGVARLQGGVWQTWTRAEGLPYRMVTDIAEDSAGKIWLSVRDGSVMVWDGTSFQLPIQDKLDGVHGLLFDRHGALWLATNASGLCRFYKGKLEVRAKAQGLSDDVVLSVLEDVEGNVYAGTVAGGLNQLREPKFSVFGASEGLADSKVWAVFQDRQGALWLGTASGLDRMDLATGTVTHEPGLTGAIYAVLEDREGTLWAGGGSMLGRKVPGGAFEEVQELGGVKPGLVYSMNESEDGVLRIGTSTGLYTRERGAWSFLRTDPPGPILNPLRDIARSANGDVWLATANGVKRVRDGQLTRFTTQHGLPSEFAKCLFQDSQRVLWVCTDGGLARWFPELERFKAITARDGLFDDTVLRVLEDRDGFFWFTSNRGIARVPRAELEEFFQGRRPRVSARSFGESDGLRSVECNGTSSHSGLLAKDGRLWFPTLRGAAVIDPRRSVLNTVVPAVHLAELQADHEPQALAKGLALPAGTRDLLFRYDATSFVDAAKVTFKYRLEGFDRGWVEAGRRREAFYTNLPPGDYRFRVIAANNDGVWNEEGVAQAFTLLPFLYQTLWFQLLCAAGVLGLLGAGYSTRLRYVRRREVELLRHNQELAQALGAAREAVKLKSEFVANISHELRTPLNAIINLPAGILEQFHPALQAECTACSAAFQLEKDEKVAPETPCPDCGAGPLKEVEGHALRGNPNPIVRHLRSLERSGRHLLAVINDVLDFSKLEAGQLNLQLRELAVRNVFDEVLETFRPMCESRGVRIEAGATELMVRADPVKLSQILINLVGNAMKFSPNGSQVELRARAEGASCVISVIDHGPGIAPEHQQLIFESFSQVDGSQTRRHGGTGLGLAITRKLVLLHGGEIWVESKLGEGATFNVRLPIEAGQEALPPLPEAADGPASGPVVLAVDDEPVALETLRLTLAPLGVRVITLMDPRQMIAAVQEQSPALIILDVMMPRISGLTLLRELRGSEQTKRVPVLITSAYGENRELATTYDATWLSKPWERTQLLEVVKRLLATPEAMPPAKGKDGGTEAPRSPRA